MYVDHCVSDKNGLAQIDSKDGDLRDRRGHVGLVAHHDGRGLIAFADVDSAHLTMPVEMTLVPECRVSGKLVSPELAKLGRKVGWTNVYLNLDRKRLMSCDSEEDGDFHFFVPPGRYNLDAYGTYLARKTDSITVPSGKREMELRLTLVADRFALLRGFPAPQLRDIVAWKNSPPLKLADLKGKCVLLYFWGHWCDPCVHHMPWTFDLYDRFARQGLVVIGIHVEVSDADVDTVEKLDAKLAGIRKTIWHGRDIPYPVALARPNGKHCAVVEDYGIHIYSSQLLIDRRGNIVDLIYSGPPSLALLQKTLDEKPAGDGSRSDHR